MEMLVGLVGMMWSESPYMDTLDSGNGRVLKLEPETSQGSRNREPSQKEVWPKETREIPIQYTKMAGSKRRDWR